MSVNRHLFSFAVLAFAAAAYADQPTEERAASWEPVIVLTDNAQVMAGEKIGPKIAPGTVLYISERQGEWLLVPRYNYWLHDQHARSLPQALTELNTLIAKEPTGPRFHYRAIVLSELGRIDEALRDFDAAIRAGTATSNVFLNRGLAWWRAGDRQKALADIEESIRRDDQNAHAYFNRGVLRIEDEQWSAGIADYTRAIELDPDYAEAFNNRGVAREHLGDRAAALADYDRAIELRKRYPNALTNRAYLHQLSGDYAAAIADYAAALRMAPDMHPALNDLAWLLATCPDENIRNGAAAVEYAERANKLTDNQEADYLDTLAAAAAEAGDFAKAVQSAEAALVLSPEESQADLKTRLELFRQSKPFREQPVKNDDDVSPDGQAGEADQPGASEGTPDKSPAAADLSQ